jgi:hypothetical protein
VHFSLDAPSGTHKETLSAPGTDAVIRYQTGLGLLVDQLTFKVAEDEDDLSDACEKAIARLQGKNRSVWGA